MTGIEQNTGFGFDSLHGMLWRVTRYALLTTAVQPDPIIETPRLPRRIREARRVRCTAFGQRNFASEADLVSAIKETFSATLGSAWTWLQELDSPNGIADLVAARLTRGFRVSRLASLSPRWGYALRCLPYQTAFTVDWFAAACGVTNGHAKEVLTEFMHAGYCERATPNQAWMKVSEPQPIAERIVAIEAKLRDWRKALYQSTRYLDYAAEAWVVMDLQSIAAAQEHVEKFSARGIGLMVVGPTGQSEILARPVSRPPRMITRFWHANVEIARRLEGSLPAGATVEAI